MEPIEWCTIITPKTNSEDISTCAHSPKNLIDIDNIHHSIWEIQIPTCAHWSELSEQYNCMMDEQLKGIPHISRITDDFVVCKDTWEEYVQHVVVILMRCAELSNSLNHIKFQCGSTDVEFDGYILSTKGFGLSPCMLTQGHKNFPKPVNIT